MCGIAGIFHYGDPERVADRETVIRMTRVLHHRGPDDEGYFFDGPVGLGHRRLSIVDLSPTGHQPMPNEDSTCWITYNGEFYNHQGFRSGLIQKGHHFRGSSDTETLLHLLEENGPECLEKVAGIFGFAYWNSRARELLLARDPLGVKQLYVYDDGASIYFASEIKALFGHPGTPRQLDAEGLNQYVHFHSTLFDRTFFSGIQQLCPGEFARVALNGSMRRHKYWALRDFSKFAEDDGKQIQQLRDDLEAVVSEQLMADVPVGSFFSGGIDSSAVASFASRAGKPPKCFGVHFTDQGVIDERPYQEAAAKAIGVELQLTTLDGSTFPEDILRLVYYQDQPVIGPAMFPMYAVSRLAADNVKVCLGGQGADEIFGGYARYALTNPLQVVSSWWDKKRHSGSMATNESPPLNPSVSGNIRHQILDWKNLRRLVRNARSFGDGRSLYFENFAKVPEREWRSITESDSIISRARCRETFYDTVRRSPATNLSDKIMHWDVQTYLPGLFHQDDRMSMACSLESRVPIADPRIVQLAFKTGFNLKVRGGSTKWILRQAVADVLPPLVLNRKKCGFDTPVAGWMRGRHFDFVRSLLLSSEASQRGLWNRAGMEKLLERQDHPYWTDIVWKSVCIEAWAKVFLSPVSIAVPASSLVASASR